MEEMLHDIEKYPLETYETYLLKHLTKIYCARKETIRTDWTKYSDLLIDKFAIHSSTLFHLINGIIEHKNDDPNVRKVGFDLFSCNSIVRVLIETYIAFNHVFVVGKSEEEREFRFLLWQLDGLLEQQKFIFGENDFEGIEKVVEAKLKKIDALFDQIESTSFCKTLPAKELIKVFNKTKRKANWKFKIAEDLTITPLKIVELIEFTCVSKIFLNLYKYASMHTHSGFVSIEHFEQMRGKQVPDEYVNTLITQAFLLTVFIIRDICFIDPKAQKAFLKFAEEDKDSITGINRLFRHI